MDSAWLPAGADAGCSWLDVAVGSTSETVLSVIESTSAAAVLLVGAKAVVDSAEVVSTDSAHGPKPTTLSRAGRDERCGKTRGVDAGAGSDADVSSESRTADGVGNERAACCFPSELRAAETELLAGPSLASVSETNQSTAGKRFTAHTK